ncbi:MAG: hypothetical protein J0M24_05815 [Verrucomicrobia bacterium]|nr:hypothetical protein [Verrucomicrobiota bacterium]
MNPKVPRGIPNNPEAGLSFPHVVTRRHGTATIYQYQRTKGGVEYTEFKLAAFDSAGRRSFRSFSNFNEALKEAEARLAALGQGLVEVTTLHGPTRLDYLNAIGLLPLGRTLTDAVNALLREHTKPKADPIRVSDLVAAFLHAKEGRTRSGRPASDAYRRDLEWRLSRFVETFQMDISDVSPRQIEDWIEKVAPGPVNAWNMVRLLRTLFRWAQKRGHLPSGPLPTDSLDIHKPVSTEAPGILTPAQLKTLLASLTPSMVPYGALAAFAGLRQAEIQRLDWSEISFDRGHIEVTAAKAKTAGRRLVPLLPVLRTWLEPYRATGPVCDLSNVAKPLLKAAKAAGIAWKRNALRHSYISYRVAALQDVSRVALEAGNSPAMIFKHYRELVTPETAAAWFDVQPSTKSKNAK